MGLMDRLYRFGSKPYIMDYNGAVNFLGRCVVPIQIGDIIGSVLNNDKTPPTVFYFPVRITKPLNYKFTNVNIKLVTLSNTAFSSSRIRIAEAKLYTDKNVEVTSTQTTHRWLDTGVTYPTGSQYTYIEGVNVQVSASNIASYNNYYILKVTVGEGITGTLSQTKIFLEYDNYVSFLNTMENQRFNENQLQDFMFNDILANDMYQVGYFDSIYAKWADKKKEFWNLAGSKKESISYKGISGTFFSTDEIIFKVPSVVAGHHWRLYAGGEQLTPSLKEIGRTGTGEWFLKLTTNWWSGSSSLVADTPICCFAMDGQPKWFVQNVDNSMVVASVMNYPNYTFKRYNGDTLIETVDEDIHPFYFNIFNKKTRVISAGDYADNLTLNRAVEAKWNVEKFTEMISEGEEFTGWMKNYPMVKPPVVYTPTYNNGYEAGILLDFNMACLTEVINNIPIRSYKDESCNSLYPQTGGGYVGTPFGKESTTLWQIPFGVMIPVYSIAGGQPSGFGG